jgi:hypothetical protein
MRQISTVGIFRWVGKVCRVCALCAALPLPI